MKTERMLTVWWRWVWCVVLSCVAGVSAAEPGGWLRRPSSMAAAAWRTVRCDVAGGGEALSLRCAHGDNGFAFPVDARFRLECEAEADVTMRQRLAKGGWNLAGVTLYHDGANFWMLALVEGPDGRHSVDFIENLAGVWQAQGEPKTALRRDGNLSFDWRTGRSYRLRLACRDGRIRAEVSDAADGQVYGAATYELGAVPAVCGGRPGVIVRASEATISRFAWSVPEHPSVPSGLALREGLLGRVALLDDALPGHDRDANARLSAALAGNGIGVTHLTAEQMIAPDVLTGGLFAAAIIPQCASVPVALESSVLRYQQEGGHLVFIGGPFLDHPFWRIGDAWIDKAGQRALLRNVTPRHRPFELGPRVELNGWRRTCANGRTGADFAVTAEGPGGAACLRMDICDLQGWDGRQSPELPAVFGEGDDLFTFLGKGDAATSELAVEINERDGSRWIAVAPLTTDWRRVGLRLKDFHFWADSRTKGRGHAGDRLNPAQAVRLSFALSASHTPGVGGGAHTVWLADIGTAADLLREAGADARALSGTIECVYPRYKVHVLSGDVTVRAPGGEAPWFAPAGRCREAVCAISRTLGEGYGRGSKWRFKPLAEAVVSASKATGVCEWLLLNTRFPVEGAAMAGFGYTDPAVWSSPDVVARIVGTVRRMLSGLMLEEAGTEQFAYWPGEPVRIGGRVRFFGATGGEASLTYSVLRTEGLSEPVSGGRRVMVANTAGAWDELLGTWTAGAPGDYTVVCAVEGSGGVARDIRAHRFRVLDPTPAPREAHITVRDGTFRLAGEAWCPVGVNYWPLYVSGMDQDDYSSGWLKHAYYAPSLVVDDLEQMRDMGINMVSIQTPPLDHHRNLLHFLALCRQYGIHANLYVGQASPTAFRDAELKTYLETARLPGNASVFAYDTIWEPGNYIFKDDNARARWDADWRAWVDEQYGSLERAEKDWGVKARRDGQGRAVSPPDKYFREDGPWRTMMAAYRRFMDNLTSKLWGRANRRLRELDPNHLVSFRQGNTLPYDFALSGPVKHIDFICPEGYSIRDTDEGEDAIGFITRYVDFTTGGKPIVWSEFGISVWDGNRMAPDASALERQGRYDARFYRTGLAAGAAGTVPWWWVGGYRVNEKSDFGIIAPDRTERPAARLIREYGPRFKAARARPRPDTWFAFDRDAHAGGYWRAAFNEGAAAYREAVGAGKRLGVRTAGTGTDSATTPLVAVGNVPCDGTNPPKYLDAEFGFLQVLDAAGVWREALNGAVFDVAPGRPVRARASVANMQEATWLPGDATGGVALVVRVGGKEVCRRGIAERVAYLGDAVFGAFDLLPSAPTDGHVSVRMEARGRTAFGESREFAVRSASSNR